MEILISRDGGLMRDWATNDVVIALSDFFFVSTFSDNLFSNIKKIYILLHWEQHEHDM